MYDSQGEIGQDREAGLGSEMAPTAQSAHGPIEIVPVYRFHAKFRYTRLRRDSTTSKAASLPSRRRHGSVD